jgi:hypothetical protein
VSSKILTASTGANSFYIQKQSAMKCQPFSKKWRTEELAPSRWVAAKIVPYFVVLLAHGAAMRGELRLV